MRRVNFVGFGMLTFGIVLNEWVYLYLSERFNIVLVVAVAIYMVGAVGLSLWGSPSRECTRSALVVRFRDRQIFVSANVLG